MVLMQEKYSFLVGIPSNDRWSVGNVFSNPNTRLFVTCTAEQGDETVREAKKMLAKFKEWMNTPVPFDDAVSYFSALQVSPSISFALVYVEAEHVICTACRGTIHLLRAGSALPLVTESETVSCVQGTVYPNDSILFGTQEFARGYLAGLEQGEPYEQLQKLASNADVLQSPLLSGCVLVLEEKVVAEEVKPEPTDIRAIEPPIERPSEPPVMHMSSNKRILPSFGRLRLNARLFKIGLLLLILVVGILGIQRFVIGGRQTRIDQAVNPLSDRLAKIQQDASTPRMEKERLLGNLERDTRNAQDTYKSDPAIRSKLDEVWQKVHETYLITSKQQMIEHLSVFYDFRLVTPDLIVSQVALDVPGKLGVFLDSGKKRLVSLSLEKKQPQTVSVSDDIGVSVALTVVDRKAYVLGSKGIYEVSLPLDTAGKLFTPSSSLWQDPKLIGSFGDNLYTFDKGVRQIFRYDRNDASASPSAWLRGKEGVDIDQISSLSIDGDVWMGTTEGKVYKFTRGDRVDFNFQDILSPPQSSVSIYTTPESSKLYVLEPRQKRLVIFEKSGQFVSAVVSPDLASATAVVVDEDGKTAYVSAGSIVFAVPL